MTPRVGPHHRAGFAAAVAVLAAVLSAGCGAGSTPTSGGPDADRRTSQEASVDIGSTPATEQPSVEGSRASRRQVSIRVPILVPGQGGPGEADPRFQCLPLEWYGYSGSADVPIPDDVVISFTGISLDPPGIFVVGGDVQACAAGQLGRPCSRSTVFTSRQHGCSMVVTQIAEADPTLRVRVRVSANASCAELTSCRVVREFGASTSGEPMAFSPIPGAVSGSVGSTSGPVGSPSAGGESLGGSTSPASAESSPTGG